MLNKDEILLSLSSNAGKACPEKTQTTESQPKAHDHLYRMEDNSSAVASTQMMSKKTVLRTQITKQVPKLFICLDLIFAKSHTKPICKYTDKG